MISRTLVIVLAVGAGAYRVATGAVLEGTGLFAMAAGLLCLQRAGKRPVFKWIAVSCFAMTGAVIAYVLWRNTQ